MKLVDAELLRQQCYVDGAWTDADEGQSIEVTNPADGSVIGTIPKMGAAETRRAIAAADASMERSSENLAGSSRFSLAGGCERSAWSSRCAAAPSDAWAPMPRPATAWHAMH